MGIGMVLIVSEDDKEKVEDILKDYKACWIGKITKGSGKVILK